ncbi:GPI inositol-deacylase isoform 1 [Schistosoma japonicum]|uniref:GPI inositol-deacylase n=1 Tax=Schistosoma japonicum TaxID=6182 RepID=A0A4Z2DKZ1_SCHJA|nr:GPI inositol-deacylase isoform 1 [Schistosoma japonicum]
MAYIDIKKVLDMGTSQYFSMLIFKSRLYNLPVLFVTGSKGSFKTVRSLATTIYDLVQYNSPFDYYTVDLNEEQSALNGEIIERQTDFVDKAISTILGIYVILPNPPEHIVLIGHSVGSVVILNLLSTRWSLNQTKVKLVISLAGPLYQPVILPDRSMAQIHYRAHNYLNQISMISNYPLVIISITGGSRDRIVPDILGYIDLAYPGLNSLSLFTSSIQNVWASCDHRCILWCLQLMLRLNQGLMVHKSLSTDPTNRLNVFRNLFITKPLLTNHTLHSKRDETPEFNLKSSQLISPHMLWIHKTNQGNSIMDFYVPYNGLLIKFGPYFDNPEQHVLFLVTNVSNNWLHLCIETNDTNDKHCDYIVPITSPYITRLPNPLTRTFIGAGLITLSMIQKLPIFSSLVLNFQDTKDLKLYLVVSSDTNSLWDSITILIDTFHNVNQRIHSNLPNHPSLLPFYEKNPVTIFNPNLTGIFHRFYLPPEFYYLSPSTISPSLLVKRTNCSIGKRFMGMITLNTIWCNYFHYVAIENEETEITFQLPISHVSLSNYLKESPSFIDLYLDPNCVYEVSVYYSLVSWFSQLIRLHFMHFGGLLCGHLLLSLILLTFRLIAPNENHSLCNSNLNSISIIHEIHYHLGVAFIHFLSFQLISLPFSEWIELQKTGQLGLRLITTLQLLSSSSSSVYFANYLELILGHLPFLIISLPWGFIVPILNCIFDNGFLFLSRIIHRNDCSIIKQNDNLSSSSTLFMNISTLCILSVGWILSESVAVLLLSLLLLINFNSEFMRFEFNITNSSSIDYQQKLDILLYPSMRFLNVSMDILP